MRCETLHPNQNLLAKTNIAALVTMHAIVSISNIACNSIIAYSLWRLKMTRTLSYKFIFFLSISDAFVGIAVSPVIVSLLVLQRQPFCILEHVAQSLTFMVCQFSGIMVVIITLDRYLHMKYLTRYNMYMTKGKAYTLITLNLNSCLVTGTLLMLAAMYGFIFQFEVCLVSVYATFVLVIFLLYLKTFVTLRQRVNDMSMIRNDTAGESNGKNKRSDIVLHKRQKSEMIFAKGMIFVLLGTALSYLPCFLSGTIWAYKKYVHKEEPAHWLHSLLFWTCILMFSNSTMNPAIMLIFNKRLRQYVLKHIRPGFISARDVENTEPTEAFQTRRDLAASINKP